MQRCGLVWNSHSWNDTLLWMAQHLKGKKPHHVIPKICLGSFEASFIYGFNTGVQRVLLWESLRDLASSMGPIPWITLGDFNVTLHSAEIQGIDRGNDSEREEFCKCINDSCLFDLRYIGIFFTWCNRRFDKPDFTQRKLDRPVVNCHWLESFPN